MGASPTAREPAVAVTAVQRWAPALLWALAGIAVAAMVVGELTRPLADATVAVDPRTFLSDEQIDRAAGFRAPLRVASIASILLRAAIGVAAVAWLWNRSGPVPDARWRRCGLAGLAGAAVWALADVARLPLQVWAWSRSVEAGLSTQSLPQWAGDWLLVAVPTWAGVAITVAAGVWAVERLPRTWVPVGGLVGGAVGVVVVLVSPLLLEPLLLSFTPLPDGPLRQDIAALVEATGEDVDAELLVADASRRTTASNAYVSGLGQTRRIVLYDTLLADAPDDEVLAIVAHELAHDVNGDLERGAAAVSGGAVLLLALLSVVLRGRLRRPDGVVSPAAAAMAVGVVLVVLVATTPVERWASRRAEHAADAGALALTMDGPAYAAMMAGLATRNLSDPDPPRWYVAIFHTHPPVAERIGRARALR
jgi:STE24 endopeptidase